MYCFKMVRGTSEIAIFGVLFLFGVSKFAIKWAHR